MKKISSIFILLVTIVPFKGVDANVIRLYQESDREILCAMIANNEELLLPIGMDSYGMCPNNKEEQIASTARFFGSKNYTTKVCVKDDKPIGFITYQKEVAVKWWLRWIFGAPGAIQIFNVHEDHRRHGIGASLLQNALTDMKNNGFDSIIVQTRVANGPARTLYEKHGFILAGPVVSGALDCLYTCKL